MRFVRRSPFVLAFVALLSISLFAAVSANLRGQVTDPSGAAAAGTRITVVNIATGFTRTAIANATGEYELLGLPVGRYDVTFTKAGFQTFRQKGLVLTVGQNRTLNARLAVGSVSQTVEVSANTLSVNTTNAQLGTVVNAQQMVTLPLVNRDWLQFQTLQPGVAAASDRFGTYATNGNRTQANGFLLDGIAYEDSPLNTPQSPPSPDAIEEFRMVTSVMDAQYGNHSGAVINAVTKSGGNQFHGDVFEFYRDTALDAADFFQNTSTAPGSKVSVYHQNEFGGTIGGPIIKNHLFFFFSYQGYRQMQGAGQQTTVFTAAQANGQFGSLLQNAIANEPSEIGFATASPEPLYGDSASPCPVGGSQCPAGTPYSKLFSTGTIPSQDFNPLALKLLKDYVPLPNAANSQYAFSTANINPDDQYIWRIDEDFGPNDQLSFIGKWERSPTIDTLPFTGADLPGFTEVDNSHTQRYDLHETHVFSPTILNQFRIGYTRLNFQAVSPQNPVSPSSYGFTGITPQNGGAEESLPFVNVANFFNLGFSYNGPQPRVDDTGEIADNFSWIHGNHTFKFGEDIRRLNVYNPFNFVNNGYFGFDGTGAFSTGLGAADFLLGYPDFYEQTPGGVVNARTYEYYLYGEDQWQVTPDLTLTLGTGWQTDTPLVNNYFGGEATNGFIAGEQSKIFPSAPKGMVFPGDFGMPPGGYSTHYDNFAPRAAFAWAFKPGWSLRGGYGIFYNAIEEEDTLYTLSSPPFGLTSVTISPTFAAPYTTYTGQGTSTVPNPFPFVFPKPGSSPNFAQFEPMDLDVYSPDLATPYNQNFNLTLQHQLSSSMLATLTYSGSLGRKLEGTIELNPLKASVCLATPGCAPSNEIDTPATGTVYNPSIIASMGQSGTFLNSSYNSFQAELQKSFTNGLMFQVAYTWSHALDQGSSLENSEGNIDPFNLNYSYGNSTYDQPQRLVLNYVYDIPAPNFATHLTHGWEVSGITTLQSGFPYTIENVSTRNMACDPNFTTFGCWDRPNQVSGVTYYTNPRSAPNHAWFLGNAFAPQPLGTNGNAGRDEFMGPGLADYDFALIKRTQLTESKSLVIRAGFFNLFNHTNFANPDTTIGDPTFGDVTGIQGNPREVQLAAKIYF